MFDDYDARLQQDPRYFGRGAGSGNEIIEVYGAEIAVKKRFREESIAEDQIVGWLNKYNAEIPKPLLRVFVCAPEQHTSDAEVIALPFTRATLQAIRNKWHLPSEFLRMLLSTMPIKSKFSVIHSGAKYDGIMLRGGRSKDWNYCVTTTKCPTTGIVNCFVHGLQANEIVHVKRCLRESTAYANYAMLVPIILVEWKIHHFAVLLERRAQYLAAVENETGLIHGAADDPNYRLSPQQRMARLEEINFDQITLQLTGLVGTLYFCGMTFQSGLSSLELIEEVSKTLQALPDCFVRRITYLKGLIAGAEDSKKLLEARTQAQVDTVNTLISQRHAEAALKETYVMRIVAIVTLVFLPATAVATMFSTSFWNWMPLGQDEKNHTVVSSWVWIYFLCSILLSLAVYFFTYWMHRRQKESRDKKLGWKKRASVVRTTGVAVSWKGGRLLSKRASGQSGADLFQV
ncbi:hypothetical protein BU23DRAFT_93985 [Bimuria novae-zelandiae CBS 107.79]|uniref:Cora-domain-containing protein n=1 Tax=Bimuria novae-zelandiae CBS 107.79 TaxID=1447943 RepID=A0A6A5VHE3_9PLEO|nr:hypothetical protein BU23DRAFT_93985 [Bimuria novae-zelandiae CBS 107.79]